MAILAVDEVMLREPRLLVPGQKPLGPVLLNNVARSLQSKVVLLPNLVGPQNLTPMCTNNGGSFGPDGNFLVSAATQYLFIPKALGFLPYLTDFTIRVRYRTTITTASAANLIFGSNTGLSGARSLQIGHRNDTDAKISFIVGTSAGAWGGGYYAVFPFDIPSDGVTWVDWIGIHQRSLYKTGFINRVKCSPDITSTTGLENDATHTGWHINGEAGLNGLTTGEYALVQAWPFGLTRAECIAIGDDPFGMFDPA